MVKKLHFHFIVLVVIHTCPLSHALDSTWDLSVGDRYFFSEAVEPFVPQGEDYQNSSYISGEISADWAHNNFSFETHFYGNWDSKDESRRYTNIQQALLRYSRGNFSVSGGVDTFYWGVSETINILNTVNQSDLRKSIDGKEKFGQSHVSFSYASGVHSVKVFYLPTFNKLEFPYRPATKVPVEPDKAVCESGACDGSSGLRWDVALDTGDLAFSFFRGTRRDPILIPSPELLGTLIPNYVNTQYAAMDGVYFLAGTILKAEYKYGDEIDKSFYAYNIGIEYPTYPNSTIINSANIVLEHTKDSRDQLAESIGQNDVFIGGRFMLGDLDQTYIRTVVGFDLDHKSKFYDLSFEHRITDYVRLHGKAIYVDDVPKDDTRLFLIENESFVEMSLHFAF